jgi:hypothetical protein
VSRFNQRESVVGEVLDGEVVIRPGFDPDYCNYVVLGFEGAFGAKNVSCGPISELPPTNHPYLLVATVRIASSVRTIAVDVRDHAEFSSALVEAVSIYGKTNLRAENITESLVPIGPTFGVSRSWRAYRIAQLKQAGMKSGRLSQRVPIAAYRPSRGRDNYVFFLAWPWSKHQEVTDVRVQVIQRLQALPIEFEGGLVPLGRLRPRPVPGLEQVSARRQYRHREFLELTRRSGFAVNTPAVHDCLGWKLGEFLALGKACVSLPLSRSMPGDFVSGEHVHIVEDVDAMGPAFELLLGDHAYRRHLEEGARRYWEHFLQPEAMVRRLVKLAFETGRHQADQ